MEITGRLVSLLPIVTGTSAGGKQWQKLPFIIETSEQYPKKIALQAWGDVAGIVSKFKVGDKVVCGINVESREYNGAWFTDVKCWKINAEASGEHRADDYEFDRSSEGDDLPF